MNIGQKKMHRASLDTWGAVPRQKKKGQAAAAHAAQAAK